MSKFIAITILLGLFTAQAFTKSKTLIQLQLLEDDSTDRIPSNEADYLMIGDLTNNGVSDYITLTNIEPAEGVESLTWADIEGDEEEYDEALKNSDNPDVYSAT